MNSLDRITFNKHIMGGKACIRGMRITVSMVLNLMANGLTNEDIMREYPDLNQLDIQQCLKYAAYLAMDEIITTPEATV